MRALVVYESMFGNTERLAAAIAAGVSRHLEVESTDVASAPQVLPESLDLLVVGGPTHAFSMTRADTWKEAFALGPQSFHVLDVQGPLVEGELARARASRQSHGSDGVARGMCRPYRGKWRHGRGRDQLNAALPSRGAALGGSRREPEVGR